MRGPPCAKIKAASGTPKSPSTPLPPAWRWIILRLELRIGHRLAHGTHPRRRHMARLQEVFPFVRCAREHDLAQHLSFTRPVGVPLLIGLLDHVGPLKQRPQTTLLP